MAEWIEEELLRLLGGAQVSPSRWTRCSPGSALGCVPIPTVVGISMSQLAAKLSVSVPVELAMAVRRRVGARGLSGFVARAMAHELERDQLRAFLTELDQLHGQVPAAQLAKVRRAWPKL